MTQYLTSKELWDNWSYEFKEWIEVLQSVPKRLIASKDYSQSYEMDRIHLFELENGKFAVIKESGCSCYCPSNADIDLFPNHLEAQSKFQTYDNEYKNRGW